MSLVCASLLWRNLLTSSSSGEEVLINAASTDFCAGNCGVGDLLERLAVEVLTGSFELICESLALGHCASLDDRSAHVLCCWGTTRALPASFDLAGGGATISVLGISVIALIGAKVQAITAYFSANAISSVVIACPSLLHRALIRAAVPADEIAIIASLFAPKDVVSADGIAVRFLVSIIRATGSEFNCAFRTATVSIDVVAVVALILTEVDSITTDFLADGVSICGISAACPTLLYCALVRATITANQISIIADFSFHDNFVTADWSANGLCAEVRNAIPTWLNCAGR